jgi:hypothetical protein
MTTTIVSTIGPLKTLDIFDLLPRQGSSAIERGPGFMRSSNGAAHLVSEGRLRPSLERNIAHDQEPCRRGGAYLRPRRLRLRAASPAGAARAPPSAPSSPAPPSAPSPPPPSHSAGCSGAHAIARRQQLSVQGDRGGNGGDAARAGGIKRRDPAKRMSHFASAPVHPYPDGERGLALKNGAT